MQGGNGIILSRQARRGCLLSYASGIQAKYCVQCVGGALAATHMNIGPNYEPEGTPRRYERYFGLSPKTTLMDRLSHPADVRECFFVSETRLIERALLCILVLPPELAPLGAIELPDLRLTNRGVPKDIMVEIGGRRRPEHQRRM